MPRIHSHQEYIYSEDDAEIRFPRKNYQAEILSTVNKGGVAYVGRMFAGEEVVIMVRRRHGESMPCDRT